MYSRGMARKARKTAPARRKKTAARKPPVRRKKSPARAKKTARRKPAARKRTKRGVSKARRPTKAVRKPTRPKRGTRPTPRPSSSLRASASNRGGLGADAGGQSGDIEGLPRAAVADSESVEELAEEGQAFEAGIVDAVENAPDADEGPIRTREVPEDDVPEEYLDDEG